MDELWSHVRGYLLDVVWLDDAALGRLGRYSCADQSDAGNCQLLGAKLLGGRDRSQRGRITSWRCPPSHAPTTRSDALLTGAGLAVLANSRPYEGLLFSLPAGAFLLGWMLSKRGPSLAVSFRRIVMPIFIVLILTGTAMGFYNFCVTGNALRLPYQVHEETYAVAPIFIWQDLRPEPAYRHRDVRDFHADYIPYTSPNTRCPDFLRKTSASFGSR